MKSNKLDHLVSSVTAIILILFAASCLAEELSANNTPKKMIIVCSGRKRWSP